MNDFLKNIRNKEKRNRRSYGNTPYNGNAYPHPGYRGNEKPDGNQKRHWNKGADIEKITALLEETLPIIKTHYERLAEAVEHQTGAIERIAESLQTLLFGHQPPEKTQKQPADVSVSAPANAIKRTKSAPAIADPKGDSQESDKGDVIGLILQQRDQGDTFQDISKYLNQNEIPTFSGKGKWHAQTIHRICKKAGRLEPATGSHPSP